MPEGFGFPQAQEVWRAYTPNPDRENRTARNLMLFGLRRPGLADSIQRDYRVIVSGPTSFSAVLNSLQMGFRTLAIEKRTSEVWNLLGTVKTEFGKFGDVIEATQKKLDAASKQFESVGQRTRAINRKLKEVEARIEAIIAAHNHPSGNLDPSDADRRAFDQLTSAGELLGIRILDHVVLGERA